MRPIKSRTNHCTAQICADKSQVKNLSSNRSILAELLSMFPRILIKSLDMHGWSKTNKNYYVVRNAE